MAAKWIHAPINSLNKYLLSAYEISGTMPGSAGNLTLEVLTLEGMCLTVSLMGSLLAQCEL